MLSIQLNQKHVCRLQVKTKDANNTVCHHNRQNMLLLVVLSTLYSTNLQKRKHCICAEVHSCMSIVNCFLTDR